MSANSRQTDTGRPRPHRAAASRRLRQRRAKFTACCSFASNGAEGDTNWTCGGICDGGLAPTLVASVGLMPAAQCTEELRPSTERARLRWSRSQRKLPRRRFLARSPVPGFGFVPAPVPAGRLEGQFRLPSSLVAPRESLALRPVEGLYIEAGGVHQDRGVVSRRVDADRH